MRKIFADTFFWIAFVNPKDKWHSAVHQAFINLQPCKLITTDEVLTEFLTFYANSGQQIRIRASDFAESIRTDPNAEVQPQTRQSALAGAALYAQRPDKGYSLTDCISMNVMKQLDLTEVLTHDKHFSQEGFTVLFK